jgi:large subunit ribosomal protein L29
MELEKLINLSDEELKQQELTSAEQIFRLRFQKSLGNNEGLKKLKTLKLDIARIKTIARQRELGIVTTVRAVKTPKPVKVKAEAAPAPAAGKKAAKPAAAKASAAKKSVKTTAKAGAKKAKKD